MHRGGNNFVGIIYLKFDNADAGVILCKTMF